MIQMTHQGRLFIRIYRRSEKKASHEAEKWESYILEAEVQWKVILSAPFFVGQFMSRTVSFFLLDSQHLHLWMSV